MVKKELALNREDIVNVNGDFYIFITEATHAVGLEIEASEEFTTKPGTKGQLTAAARAKGGRGLGLTRFMRRNNETFTVGGYKMSIICRGQVQIGVNAPNGVDIFWPGKKKQRKINSNKKSQNQ